MLAALLPALPAAAYDMGKVREYQTVSAGNTHTAAITTDGSLWTWGYNHWGQLGNGTREDQYKPVKIMDNVAAVSAGDNHTAAITTDGSLWTWGDNYLGRLGDGTTKYQYKPVKIMDNVAAVSAGNWYTAAITTDGSLWTWGDNTWRQLGNGTTEYQSKPVKIMDNVAAVSAGVTHTAAITTDGGLWTWGNNYYGQLGDGTKTSKNMPVRIMDGVRLPGSGVVVTPTTPGQSTVSGDIDLKARMYFDMTGADRTYGTSEITYDAEDGSYSQDKIGLNISLTCLDFGGRDSVDVSAKITLPEGLSFSPNSDERSKTVSETLWDKFFESSKSIYADVYVRNASIGTHTASAKLSGDGIEESELSAELSIKPYVFEVEKYRADWLLNWDAGLSSMENTYFKENPGELFVEAGKQNGMESLSDFWRGMNDLVDTVEDVSKLGDIVFEDKDMYEAILWDIFESSLDFNTISKIDAQIQSNGKNVFDYVSGQMKTIYGLTVADKSMYNSLPDNQKETWNKLVSDSFADEYPKLDKSIDIAKAIGNFIDVANDLEDVVNRVSAYCMMASMQDSMKQVMNQMYQQCPSSETAMKAALLNCVNIMNSSSADVSAEIILAIAGSTGKRLGQIGISALWSGVMTGVKNAHPAVAVMFAAYKTGTFVSNALFNTDAITESYHKMDAVVKTEEIARGAYYWLKSKYQDNETEENAAAYNSAIDVMFNVIDKDCDSAIAFIDSVGDSFVESLKATFGDTTAADQKDSVKSIQDSTYLEYESILTGWVFQLQEDNVKEYNNYKSIIDESEERINKRYHIACPVDVYVYDENGREVASVTDDGTHVSDNSDIAATAYNGEKYIFLDDSSYRLEYRATGSGAMDITIDEYDETGDVMRQVGFDSLPLGTGDVYRSEDSNEYVVSLDGETISPDYDTDTDPEAAVRTQIEMDDDIAPEDETNGSNRNEMNELNERQKAAIEYAMERSILTGYEDGSIRPFNTITRAEFATIMCRYYDYSVDTKCDFDDSREHWASMYIKACVDKDAINGIGNNKFDPDGTITYEQALKIFTILNGYTDGADIDALGGYPDAYIKIASDIGLTEGFTVTSIGKGLPRVDVAMMIYNASEIKDYSINYDTGLSDDKSETNTDNNLNNNSDVESSDILPERIKNKYDDISDFEYHNNDWALVKIDDRRGMIDKNGNEVIPTKYDAIFSCHDYRYYIVVRNKKHAVINDNNEIILDYQSETVNLNACPNADYIEYWDNRTDETNISALITYNGEEIIPKGKYAYINYYSDDCIVCTKEISHDPYIIIEGIIDIDGNIIMPFNYSSISRETDNKREIFVVTTEDEQSGIIDIHENTIVPIEYDYMFFWNSSLITVRNNSKYGVIDINNNKIIPIEYDDISVANKEKGLVIVEKQDRRKTLVGMLNLNNQVVIPIEYDKIHYENDSKIYTQKNGLWGMIDINNRVITDFKLECDYIYSDADNKYFIAEKNDICAIVTNTLEQVTDFEYSWADAARKCKAMNKDEAA